MCHIHFYGIACSTQHMNILHLITNFQLSPPYTPTNYLHNITHVNHPYIEYPKWPLLVFWHLPINLHCSANETIPTIWPLYRPYKQAYIPYQQTNTHPYTQIQTHTTFLNQHVILPSILTKLMTISFIVTTWLSPILAIHQTYLSPPQYIQFPNNPIMYMTPQPDPLSPYIHQIRYPNYHLKVLLLLQGLSYLMSLFTNFSYNPKLPNTLKPLTKTDTATHPIHCHLHTGTPIRKLPPHIPPISHLRPQPRMRNITTLSLILLIWISHLPDTHQENLTFYNTNASHTIPPQKLLFSMSHINLVHNKTQNTTLPHNPTQHNSIILPPIYTPPPLHTSSTTTCSSTYIQTHPITKNTSTMSQYT